MLTERHFSVPDHVFFALANLVVVATILFAFILWPTMPPQAPSWYGWGSSTDDIFNSRLTVLLVPAVFQLLILFFAAWAYRHPQFFHYPTRQKFSSFTPATQRTLAVIARHLLAVVTVVAVLLLAHVFAVMVLTGLDLPLAVSIQAITFLLGFLILVLVVYSAYLRQVIVRSRAGRQS